MSLRRAALRHAKRSPWLYRLGRRLQPLIGEQRVWHCLDRLARAKGSDVSFVQIGAHDGITGDNLREFVLRHGWRGLFVEPVPGMFEKLKTNYASRPRLSFANVAISDRAGRLPFYQVAGPGEGHKEASQLSSFNRQVILKHRDMIPNIEDLIEEIEVEALPLSGLFAREGIEQLDLLYCDTEGHDARVLSQLDLDRWKPALIVYEHKHIPDEEEAACRSRLAAAGYRIRRFGMDTAAELGG